MPFLQEDADAAQTSGLIQVQMVILPSTSSELLPYHTANSEAWAQLAQDLNLELGFLGRH